MKVISLLTICLLTITSVSAQEKISATNAIQYIGKKVTICDTVSGVKWLEQAKSQPTFLNMGAPYPQSPFTVVIFGNDRKVFSDTLEKLYTGKKICVTGIVREYKGKAEIIVTKPDEIIIE